MEFALRLDHKEESTLARLTAAAVHDLLPADTLGLLLQD